MKSRNSIKHIVILLLLFPVALAAQRKEWLNPVLEKESLQPGQAIMYGNFIQRLGFSSGGFTQDISIQHLESGTVYTFRVKQMMKSAKENDFFFHILPGRYVILTYYWSKSKWYGATVYTEPVYKHIASSQVKKMLEEGRLRREDLQRYEFVIAPDSINYVGTWHFEEEIVSFTDDKTRFDEQMRSIFKKLHFADARVALPN